MPLPVITGAYRLTMHWTTDDPVQHAVNVIHILNPTSGDQSDQVHTDFIAALAAAQTETTGMFEPVTTHASLDAITIIPLDGVSPTHEYGDTDVDGGIDGDWIPSAAGVVTLYTDHGGRSARGRVFLPFVAEAAQSTGSIESEFMEAWEGGWTNFAAYLDGTHGGNSELVVASYKLGELFGVISTRPRKKLGTQRRRQERVT